jgi:hypothetical protein
MLGDEEGGVGCGAACAGGSDQSTSLTARRIYGKGVNITGGKEIRTYIFGKTIDVEGRVNQAP